MNKQDLIQQLSLVEHIEGGYFAEIYRSTENVATEREGNDRAILTSIYYLLTDDRPIDRLHRNQSDIIHYFHLGSPVTYLILHPNGKLERVKLGANLLKGEVPQLLVSGGCWKAAVLEAGEFGLLGEAVAPGFDYRDMEIAKEDYFRANFPDLWDELAPYI
ncbi:cupin domain-containing protein [Lusitaniella coriacea]|uniref:cupin domain-containing protein n=1 Tax=Lusitaniella coriacea TaxID=1983105 RepID=UPI003CE95080